MAGLPKPFRPMLAAEVKRPFHKEGWVYEEKYDGYRAVVYKRGRHVQIVSRNLKDLTAQFAELAGAVAKLRAASLILDGEIAVFDDRLASHLGYLRSHASGE